MKIWLSSIAMGAAILQTAAAAGPRGEMARAERLFLRGEFAAAAEAFAAAAAAAPARDLDPAVPLQNAGVARHRAADTDRAVADFIAATRTPDLAQQSLAYYNAGSARLLQVQQDLRQGSASNLMSRLAHAIECLEQSLLIQPGREDTRHNLEVALGHQTALLAALARLAAAMEAAGRQVADHHFAEAHETLRRVGDELAPALSLNPAEQKQFERLLERTGQISGILKAAENPDGSP